jgi:hypothetical protein
MRMTEDVAMDGVQPLIVVILLEWFLIQIRGGSVVAVHLQEVFGADHTGIVKHVIGFLEYVVAI